MKKIVFIFIIAILAAWPNFLLLADNLADRLVGRILLQVEENGEAWYLSPDNNMRYFLGRPEDAFNLMRERGLGIKHDELTGYLNNKFPVRLSGKILLDVEANGEAYYIYPGDFKGYFLGRPADAFGVMRDLGLGISNSDLETITAITPSYNLDYMELIIHDLVNQERVNAGLNPLIWNSELAVVAREHSRNLARENENFTGLLMSCNFPIIHHEGLDFGMYNAERLNSRGVYYFSKTAENIALMPGAAFTYTFYTQAEADRVINTCKAAQKEVDERFDTAIHSTEDENEKLDIIREEIARRTADFKNETELDIARIKWDSFNKLANETVQGWMNSPGHRENILVEDFEEAGLGIAYVNSYIIATQIFVKRADCGFKTGPCCELEGYYPYCFKPLTCGEGNKCME